MELITNPKVAEIIKLKDLPASYWFLLTILVLLCTSIGLLFKSYLDKKQKYEKKTMQSSYGTQLTPSQMKLLQQAKILASKGNTLEAAKLLETNNMHRFAIDMLEVSGLIDEGADILLRLNRPNRAGAFYFKHGKYEKAGEIFLSAKLINDAINSFLKLGETSPRGIELAADLLEQNKQYDQALSCYMQVKKTSRIISLSFTLNNFDYLVHYMSEKSCALKALEHLNDNQLISFMTELPLNENMIDKYVSWFEWSKHKLLLELFFAKTIQKPEYINMFFTKLNKQTFESLIKVMSQDDWLNSAPHKEVTIVCAKTLYINKNYSYASKLYVAAGRYVMAAKCQCYEGNLQTSLELLGKSEEVTLLPALIKIINTQKAPQINPNTGNEEWGTEALLQAKMVFESIDPDTDEVQSTSPFSICA